MNDLICKGLVGIPIGRLPGLPSDKWFQPRRSAARSQYRCQQDGNEKTVHGNQADWAFDHTTVAQQGIRLGLASPKCLKESSAERTLPTARISSREAAPGLRSKAACLFESSIAIGGQHLHHL